MKKKRVLDVGQCPPDHMAIREFMDSMGADTVRVALPREAMELLQQDEFALVLVNRKIDQDYTDGIELVKLMQQNGKTKSVPVMLVSNFPEAQDEAMACGALRGFGKRDLGLKAMRERITEILA